MKDLYLFPNGCKNNYVKNTEILKAPHLARKYLTQNTRLHPISNKIHRVTVILLFP